MCAFLIRFAAISASAAKVKRLGSDATQVYSGSWKSRRSECAGSLVDNNLPHHVKESSRYLPVYL